jgi:hypothetical protein
MSTKTMIFMHEEPHCEYCYTPRPASGCGWILVYLVGVFVAIMITLATCHEIKYHSNHDRIMDSTLFDHSKPPGQAEMEAADSAYFESRQPE